ncbi:MAG TPA: tetratricopeptide repeat protein [Terracidiphilus sp.]|nr:tetratricopeptide repeat protein [Terracidiphilus sp.]
MMTLRLHITPLRLAAATALAVLPLALALAQNAPATSAPAGQGKQQPAQVAMADARPAAPSATTAPQPNRAQAYFHVALAATYEDDALSDGRPEDITRAIEEYKLALDADPDSPELMNALADLYFRTPGHEHDAEVTERTLLKTHPDDINAHKMLGRIYLRQLGENESGVSSSSPSGNVLDQAIAEFEKIISLQPRSVEDRMVLGQLYTVKHDQQKAEEQFKIARSIEPDSEDVVLNLARLYAESGDIQHAITVLESVPVNDRTPKIEFTLGAAYAQLKKPKDAIAAYQRAEDMEPSDLRTIDALAEALFNDEQYDEALKQYQQLAEADPENTEALVHISEIQRHEGKYEDALATIQKALKIDSTNLEAGYNEGLLYDVLGRFGDAEQAYVSMLDQSSISHANGAYTDEEKNNRSIFLERLAGVYLEDNKIDQALSTYQKMIDLGGDSAVRGYQGQVDAYRAAHNIDKAVEVSEKAVAANPKNHDMKLMLAQELADQGKVDDAIKMANGLLSNSADDRTVYFAIGQIDIRARRWKDAEEAFSKAEPLCTKKEDRTYLLFLRGELADRQKKMDQAEGFFRQALELDPSNAMTLNYLGYMMADKGVRLPEALTLVKKAVDIEPINGAYLDSLGWVYFKLGDYERAEDNLRQAVARDQTDPTVHMHLGDLYEKTGRIRLAAAQWQVSLDAFAKSLPADYEASDVTRVQKKLESARVRLAKEDHAMEPQVKPE